MPTHPFSDPVVNRAHKGVRKSLSPIVSFPVIVAIICAVANIPPIQAALLGLDSNLHAHNDAIVHWILIIAPFFVIGFAALGLFMLIRGPQPGPGVRS